MNNKKKKFKPNLNEQQQKHQNVANIGSNVAPFNANNNNNNNKIQEEDNNNPI